MAWKMGRNFLLHIPGRLVMPHKATREGAAGGETMRKTLLAVGLTAVIQVGPPGPRRRSGACAPRNNGPVDTCQCVRLDRVAEVGKACFSLEQERASGGEGGREPPPACRATGPAQPEVLCYHARLMPSRTSPRRCPLATDEHCADRGAGFRNLKV